MSLSCFVSLVHLSLCWSRLKSASLRPFLQNLLYVVYNFSKHGFNRTLQEDKNAGCSTIWDHVSFIYECLYLRTTSYGQYVISTVRQIYINSSTLWCFYWNSVFVCITIINLSRYNCLYSNYVTEASSSKTFIVYSSADLYLSLIFELTNLLMFSIIVRTY